MEKGQIFLGRPKGEDALVNRADWSGSQMIFEPSVWCFFQRGHAETVWRGSADLPSRAQELEIFAHALEHAADEGSVHILAIGGAVSFVPQVRRFHAIWRKF